MAIQSLNNIIYNISRRTGDDISVYYPIVDIFLSLGIGDILTWNVNLARLSFSIFATMEVKFVSKIGLEIELVLINPKWLLVFGAT